MRQVRELYDMRIFTIGGIAGAVMVIAQASPARADVIWNEVTQGDLSNDRFAPTLLPLSPGDNQLFGVMSGANGEGGFDLDYYAVTIPQGYVLREIILEIYLSKDFAAFIAIQPGDIFPNDPNDVTPDQLMGWAHFGRDQEFTDILALMGTNGQGFTPPLPAGTYSFWAQQIDDYTDYALNFVVEVPTPSAALVLGSLVAFGARRRRV